MLAPMITAVRRRLRLRQRLRDPAALKEDAELQWWLTVWDPVIREGGFNPGDAPRFMEDPEPEPTYMGRRWQQARAEVRRVLAEAEIAQQDFFHDKVVLDIGPGPLGFPDACPARLSIAVEPLAERFAEHGLLLSGSSAVYLATHAERIPLLSGSVDVVLARNSLDHVEDPERVLAEAVRLLAPGGTMILNFDVEHPPTATEPHTLTVERVRRALDGLGVLRERHLEQASGSEGHAVVLLLEKPVL
jgi:SAM-dependent methyltransferase